MMRATKHDNHSTTKKLALGTAVAAAAGYLTGVLTAPKSGKQTRKDLMEATNKSINEAEKELKKLHTDLGGVIENAKKNGLKLNKKTKQDLDDLLDKTKTTKDKARDMLSAVHEGDADDKDLRKAIEDANAAISHVKDFFKK